VALYQGVTRGWQGTMSATPEYKSFVVVAVVVDVVFDVVVDV
jgi:hypothetical protein